MRSGTWLGGRTAVLAVAVALVGGFGAGGAGATNTRPDASGTILLDGSKIFPIVLSKGPPRDGTTPLGGNALDEVVGAGANFFKVGPPTTVWTNADIDDAVQWDRAVAARGVYTWINLSTLSRAQPGSAQDTILQRVITTLKGDATGSAGLGMWKGADEPWWGGVPASALRFAYCRGTSRGDPSWCAGEPPLDSEHLWVTIQAPRGTAADLAPYSAVTDTHGVDVYPVTFGNADPDLHGVGRWTSTIRSVTPSASVWTVLQVCASGSHNGTGSYVLPTRLQERYMMYDAIINGARSLGFYGGNNPNCYTSTDSAHGWNWTFWYTVLKGLIQEINASSPLAPALVDPGSNQVLSTTDSTTQAIRRDGANGDYWVIAARSGAGTRDVTIGGLPSSIASGTVYTEGRSVEVENGSFTDSFDRWGVHVYRFAPPAPTAVGVRSFSARSVAGGVRLAWRTSSEATALGFVLYRERGGERVRLGWSPVVAGGAARGGRYSWLDRRAPRAGRWRYRLQAVGTDGRRSWAGTAVVRRR
ncbi:MAG: hypothetical protein ABR521_03955 [Gaiellaceae bacterium]